MVESTHQIPFHEDVGLSLKDPLTQSEIQERLDQLKMGTREWAKKELNCIKGCHNNCVYCYAKAIAKRFKRCTEKTWKIMKINQRVVDKNYGRVKKSGTQPYDIMFPTSHDIFPQEPFFSAYLKTLKKLIKAGNSVLIVSKPRESVIKNICQELKGYENDVAFRFTIGSSDNKLLKIFEPNAPRFDERLESLKIATESGFRTTVSAEPLLDSEPSKLIKMLTPHLSEVDYAKDVGTIWIGLLKIQYIPLDSRKGEIKENLNRIKESQKFENVYSYYVKYYDHPQVKWKESITKLMIENNIKVKF